MVHESVVKVNVEPSDKKGQKRIQKQTQLTDIKFVKQRKKKKKQIVLASNQQITAEINTENKMRDLKWKFA